MSAQSPLQVGRGAWMQLCKRVPLGWYAALISVLVHVSLLCWILVTKHPEPVQVPIMMGIYVAPSASASRPVEDDSSSQTQEQRPTESSLAVEKTKKMSVPKPSVQTKQPESKEKSSEESDTGASAMAPGYQAAYLNNQQPPYPLLSRRLREEGMVRLRVFVTAQGRAEQVQVLTSSGYARLDMAAEETVLDWRFIPARSSSAENIAGWVEVPIRFKLEK